MAGRRCAATVHVHTDEGAVVYLAGDLIPPAHQKLISNPNVWKAVEPEVESEPEAEPAQESDQAES